MHIIQKLTHEAEILLIACSICMLHVRNFFFHGTTAPSGPGSRHSRCFTITITHTTVGRTPLDEWSARRRDLYLTTHNTHKRQTSMLPTEFEPAIPTSERPQTHALDRAATEFFWILPTFYWGWVLKLVAGIQVWATSCKQYRWNYISFHKNLSSHRTLKHNLGHM